MRKKIIVLVSAFAILLLFAAVGPALAIQPKLTFNNINIGYPDLNQPGTRFTKDNVLHIRDSGSVGQVLGSPWGIITSTGTGNDEIYLSSYTGSGVSHGAYTCAAGSYEGAGVFEFTGIALYTYHGQSFTATTNTGGTFIVSEGTKFLGIIFTGTWCGHGIMEGKGFQMRVVFEGVVIITYPGNHGLDGDSLLTGTTTYWFTG
jgi:hypothetical protein